MVKGFYLNRVLPRRPSKSCGVEPGSVVNGAGVYGVEGKKKEDTDQGAREEHYL